MLFESESKALNFIHYNSEEITDKNGYAPKRAYFCTACGGWHVTHSDIYKDGIERKMEPIKECAHNKIDEFDAALASADYKMVYKHALPAHFRIKGYLNLAQHLQSQSYIDDALQMQKHLFDSMLNVIKDIQAEGDADAEAGRNNIAAIVYSWGVKIGNSAKGFIHKDYLEYQTICDITSELIEKYREANHKAFCDVKTDCKEKLTDRVYKYIEKIESLIEMQEYVHASKNIHFAVLMLQKKSNQITNEIIPSIDKLIELKKQIPEWATKIQNNG